MYISLETRLKFQILLHFNFHNLTMHSENNHTLVLTMKEHLEQISTVLNCLLGRVFIQTTLISGIGGAGEYCVFSKLHGENHQ